MSKSVVVYITGEDFSALEFEKLGGTSNEDVMHDLLLDGLYEDNENYFEASFHIFESVNPEFFKFVKERLIDYDAGKAANVYLMSEEEYESAKSNI